MAKGKKTGGRKKGTPNKVSSTLKDAILEAAERAGGHAGLVGYLQARALDTPGPFLTLMGKVLPMQVAGDPDNPLNIVSKDQRDAAVAAFIRANS